MRISSPHSGSISLSIFSGLHYGTRSMRHPEGRDRCLKVSEGNKRHPKIHKSLRRALKISEVLQRFSEPQNNIQSLKTIFKASKQCSELRRMFVECRRTLGISSEVWEHI
jgi:hypothetical protein